MDKPIFCYFWSACLSKAAGQVFRTSPSLPVVVFGGLSLFYVHISGNFSKTVGPVAILNQISYEPGPEVIKLFSCSTQLSMKFSPLINVKMPTTVGILTCMSGENNNLGLT